MTDKQWTDLQKVINGEKLDYLPSGFIIDCPWLPNWYGISVLDYFSNDEMWFSANKKAIETFPDLMFLPGFWSEYGMCTEPSAFGAKCSFPGNEFPHAHHIIHNLDDIDKLQQPDPQKDGLLPMMLNRLKLNRQKMEDAGHKIRFSVSRGPLNIATYLMGTTEFMTLLMMDPDKAQKLIRSITDFLKEWHQLQRETFTSIDGIMMLDDIIGFISEEDFKQFGLPYLKELYDVDVRVKFLHNDAQCNTSIKYLPEIGINLFNMAFDTDLNTLKAATNNKVTMLGNIPPRDVLAKGTPDDIQKAVNDLKNKLDDFSNVIFSCGGGMPPGVSSMQLEAFQNGLKSNI